MRRIAKSTPNITFGAVLRGMLLVATAALVLASAGCGGDETTTTSEATESTSGAGTVKVSMREFTVTPATDKAPAGEVTFDVTNDGNVPHEFLVVKTDFAPKDLPTSKGGDVDEVADGIDVIDEIQDIHVGAAESKTFKMPAGKYVLFCNLPGHYQAGQTTGFTTE